MADGPDQVGVAPAIDVEAKPSAYAWYVVLVLLVVHALAYVDRQSISFLVPPMQADLHLSEIEAGWLLGPAFMLLYLPAGAPLGWLADQSSRRGLLVAGIAVWSLSTGMFGLVRSFPALMLARAGVGLGEACIIPAAFSLIAGYFGPRTRGTAMGVVSVGIALGSGIALFGGGLVLKWVERGNVRGWPVIGDRAPWEAVFILFGLLGIAVVALMLTVREPARPSRATSIPQADALALLPLLYRRWRWIMPAMAPYVLLFYVQYGVMAWLPTLLVRRLHVGPADAAWYYGVVLLLTAPASVVIAGLLSDACQRRSRYGRFAMVMLSAPLFLLAILLIVLGGSIGMSMFGMALFTLGGAFASSTAYAAMQDMAPAALGGRILGLYAVVANLAGLGLGPLVVGSITQHVFGDPDKVGASILIATLPAWALTALFCWIGKDRYAALTAEARLT